MLRTEDFAACKFSAARSSRRTAPQWLLRRPA